MRFSPKWCCGELPIDPCGWCYSPFFRTRPPEILYLAWHGTGPFPNPVVLNRRVSMFGPISAICWVSDRFEDGGGCGGNFVYSCGQVFFANYQYLGQPGCFISGDTMGAVWNPNNSPRGSPYRTCKPFLTSLGTGNSGILVPVPLGGASIIEIPPNTFSTPCAMSGSSIDWITVSEIPFDGNSHFCAGLECNGDLIGTVTNKTGPYESWPDVITFVCEPGGPFTPGPSQPPPPAVGPKYWNGGDYGYISGALGILEWGGLYASFLGAAIFKFDTPGATAILTVVQA